MWLRLKRSVNESALQNGLGRGATTVCTGVASLASAGFRTRRGLDARKAKATSSEFTDLVQFAARMQKIIAIAQQGCIRSAFRPGQPAHWRVRAIPWKSGSHVIISCAMYAQEYST